MSAGPSGARPPEQGTRLRYAPLGYARMRPARGGDTLRAPRSQGWSGAALLVLELDTRRRVEEGRTIRNALRCRPRAGQSERSGADRKFKRPKQRSSRLKPAPPTSKPAAPAARHPAPCRLPAGLVGLWRAGAAGAGSRERGVGTGGLLGGTGGCAVKSGPV